MYKLFLLIVSITAIIVLMSFSKTHVVNNDSLPFVEIETLAGEPFSSENLIDGKRPTLLVFWATCCGPCKQELGELSKSYNYLIEEMGINLVAVSVDLPKYAKGVKPFIEKNDWKFPVYLDVERKLMHAMDAYSTPHTFLLDEKGTIVWEKQGFSIGDEEIIHNRIAEELKSK